MLKEQVQKEITQAMKEGKELVYSTLRMLSAVVVSKEKEKRYKVSKSRLDRGSATESGQKPDLNEEGLVKESQLTDEEIIEVVSSEIKKRRDAIALYKKGGRQELADKEKKEVEILQKYLPEQLSEEEVKKIVEEVIAKVNAKEIKDMGRVMAELMPKVKGRADSGVVSKIVKQSLENKQ